MSRFENKVAVVTGATSGIGRATALALASEGAKITLASRRAGALESVQQEVRAAGGDAVVVAADIKDAKAREGIVTETIAAFGAIDLLVNSAGVIESGTVETTTLPDWSAMFELNVTAVFHLMQLCTPALKERRGSIVNVSSVTGIRSFPGVLAYCSSKAALDQLT
ncbi:MAG: SDR family NAD(P)-dependent oxidoreductase, partial [Myxococcales bacterium]